MFCTFASLLFLSMPRPAHAFRAGDHVSALMRTQHGALRSEWAPLLARDAPRFGIARRVELRPLQDANDVDGVDNTDVFKIAFSFIDDSFLSPWLTLCDGKGGYVTHVGVVLTHAGGIVRKVTTTAEPLQYANGKPEHVVVHFQWDEVTEFDSGGAVNLVLVVALGVAWFAAAFAVCSLEPAAKRTLRIARARLTPHSNRGGGGGGGGVANPVLSAPGMQAPSRKSD
jgi:hypothetical protein